MNRHTESVQMDMLHGPLLKKLFIFALPLAASSILQQLFNSADTAVAGQFAGPLALAAVGGNSAIISLLINMFVGFSVGANVVISLLIGQKREKDVKDVVHTVMAMALISGFAMLIIGQAIARPLLLLIDTPTDVLNMAELYLRIFFCGMPFFMTYNFGSAVLRSIGDTRKPLYALLFAGVVNIVLNLLFVIVFHLSVAGVAIATVISDGISAFFVIQFLRHADDIIQLHLHKLSLQREYVIKIIKIGLPAGLQGMVFSFSNVVIQSAINGFGSAAVAGSAAAGNYETFVFYMNSAFCQASTTFTGQNFGAGNFDRCKKIYRLSLFSAFLTTGIMCFIFGIGRCFFLHLFTRDPKAYYYAVIRLFKIGVLEFIPPAYEVTAATLRGMGKSLFPSIVTVFGTCAVRIIFVLFFFPLIGSFSGLLNIYLISWLITAVLMMGSYYIIRRKLFIVS